MCALPDSYHLLVRCIFCELRGVQDDLNLSPSATSDESDCEVGVLIET